MYILSLWLLFCFVIIATLDYSGLYAESIDWGGVLVSNIPSLFCVVMLAICVVFYFQFRYRLSGTTMLPLKVIKICNRNSDYLVFLSTYILPLIFIDFSSTRRMVILLLLLIAIGFMYVKTDMFMSNPTLALLGYKIYEIQTENDEICGVMISQKDIEMGDSIRYIRLDRNAFFAERDCK